MFGRTQGDCLAYGEVNAQEVIVDEGHHNVLKIHMSMFTSLEQELAGPPGMPPGNEVRGLELTICKEWRAFTRRDVTKAMLCGVTPSRDEKTWNLNGRVDSKGSAGEEANEDINCKLLVGFYGARDLPSDKLTYWCKVTCTNVNNFSGGGHKVHRMEKETCRVRGNSCSTWRYPPPEGNDELVEHHYESARIIEDQESGSNMVEVVWEQPKFFHYHSLHEVELTVELFCSGKKQPLGSIKFEPSGLNALNKYALTVDEPLADHIPGLTKVPSLRILFQLWLLQSQDIWNEGSRSTHVFAELGHQFEAVPGRGTR